jgi:hypothetical protein
MYRDAKLAEALIVICPQAIDLNDSRFLSAFNKRPDGMEQHRGFT